MLKQVENRRKKRFTHLNMMSKIFSIGYTHVAYVHTYLHFIDEKDNKDNNLYKKNKKNKTGSLTDLI